jgi:hypothetical protein
MTAPPRAAPLLAPTRLLAIAALAGLLASCAGGPSGPTIPATQEAAQYRARARADYTPPGPAWDPWGPYIVEAAARFDVPDRWIRSVMRQESGGQQFTASGVLTTSPVGAMGLMQLMPATYDEVRGRYDLGDDAYDPHNNILAGTAYLREMYDAFGTPGFLAAYNGGPQRLEDYLTRNRPLPDETRRYVAAIGPLIAGTYPTRRAPAEQLAMNQLPINIPAGPRWPVHRRVLLASAHGRHGTHRVQVAIVTRHGKRVRVMQDIPVEVAEAPEPRTSHASIRLAAARTPAHSHFSLVSSAVAAEPPIHAGGPAVWKIQVGAYGGAAQAHSAARAAHVSGSHTEVQAIRQGHATLYRARLGGLTHAGAVQACHKIGHCLVVSPNS